MEGLYELYHFVSPGSCVVASKLSSLKDKFCGSKFSLNGDRMTGKQESRHVSDV